jgi:hypothetical protein
MGTWNFVWRSNMKSPLLSHRYNVRTPKEKWTSKEMLHLLVGLILLTLLAVGHSLPMPISERSETRLAGVVAGK